ncbi:unnamed protein product [Mytilus edulis]|uniref:Uncharacterized protein n=1 Tax=Mytilus edulis TaxID=6550 RepID=A0A8S3UZB0_MYTED|nr:unnamed protein product [Mytilus edulis]
MISCRTSKDKNKVMASASNIQWCEPCGRVGENQQAHSWCSDCSELEIDTKIYAFDIECTSEIEKKIKDLTTRKNKSESWQTTIKTLTEHASETRIFEAIKAIDILQVEEEVFMSKLEEDLVEYKLCSSPFEFLEKIKPILARLSEIKIEKAKTIVKYALNVQQVHAYKVQQGKPQLLYKVSCSQLEMKVLNKACFTMDDRIVFNGNPFCVYDITSSGFHTIEVHLLSSVRRNL